MNAIWSLVFKSLLRNGGRNLLQAGLIFFAAFVMAYFAQFLAGVTRNFTDNLVELATGEIYVSSTINKEIDQNVFDREYKYLRVPAPFLNEVSKLEGVETIHPRIDLPVRLNLPDDTVTFKMAAFNPENEPRLVNNFSITEGRMVENDAFEIIVPQDLARRHNINVGDSIPLLAGTVNRRVNLVQYTVVGKFLTNSLSAWFNNYVYTSLQPARVLLDDENVMTRLNIHLVEDAEREVLMPQVNALVAQYLDNDSNPELDATWWEDGAEFFSSLVFGIEAGFFIIVGIIMTILGCSMGFATVMTVIERTKEIATYGALGAPPKMIRKIFMMENVLLSDLSSLAGIGIAVIAYLLTVDVGIPINNPQFEAFIGASHFYPALDIGGFILPFIICKLVTAQVSFFIVTSAAKKPITEAIADR
ncbi:ABC transporter permease [Alteromonas sp. a30]|uniref:ABC transporter permease n=1 Tax=Alteromonas sp. a30 TaxID=2730917 RepID=UPI00227FB384|nr:FtsX-like permease family protein [Alteromonas sp. a30]MCY7295216.1 ABC transporter permease [Alteromonas sp. a30]